MSKIIRDVKKNMQVRLKLRSLQTQMEFVGVCNNNLPLKTSKIKLNYLNVSQ